MINSYPTASVSYLAPSVTTTPADSRRKTFELVARGYLALGSLVFALAALCAAGVAGIASFHLWGGVLIILFIRPLLQLLRAIRLPRSTPEGVTLRRNEARELFCALDSVSVQLRAPKIHVVYIASGCNAAVVPSFVSAAFGFNRSSLVIGFTLLKTLTLDQFNAVVAHELAHLSRKQVLGNSIINYLRGAIARLAGTFPKRPQSLARYVGILCRTYITKLNAACLPVARSVEYDADQYSIRATSARIAAQALTASNILREFLVEKYWPPIFEVAKVSVQPSMSPFADFNVSGLALIPENVAQWQRAALALSTAPADTHPCLRERLTAIDALAEFAPPTAGEAADRLLGNAGTQIAARLDTSWRRRVSGQWATIHQGAQHQRRMLQELQLAAVVSALDETRALMHASLEESVGAGTAVAMSMRLALRERFPESLAVQFALGRQLLQMGNPQGTDLIEGVVAKDPNALLAGAELLKGHYSRRGEQMLAAQWSQRNALGVAAFHERQGLQLTDQVGRHDLRPELVIGLVRQLQSVPHLEHAYLARKLVRHFPQYPLFVLGFKTSGVLRRYDRNRAMMVGQMIRERVSVPGTLIIIDVDGPNCRFARMFRRLGGSEIV